MKYFAVHRGITIGTYLKHYMYSVVRKINFTKLVFNINGELMKTRDFTQRKYVRFVAVF